MSWSDAWYRWYAIWPTIAGKNGISDGNCGMRSLIDWIMSTEITGGPLYLGALYHREARPHRMKKTGPHCLPLCWNRFSHPNKRRQFDRKKKKERRTATLGKRSHKKIKQLIAQKQSKITDRQFLPRVSWPITSRILPPHRHGGTAIGAG